MSSTIHRRKHGSKSTPAQLPPHQPYTLPPATSPRRTKYLLLIPLVLFFLSISFIPSSSTNRPLFAIAAKANNRSPRSASGILEAARNSWAGETTVSDSLEKRLAVRSGVLAASLAEASALLDTYETLLANKSGIELLERGSPRLDASPVLVHRYAALALASHLAPSLSLDAPAFVMGVLGSTCSAGAKVRYPFMWHQQVRVDLEHLTSLVGARAVVVPAAHRAIRSMYPSLCAPSHQLATSTGQLLKPDVWMHEFFMDDAPCMEEQLGWYETLIRRAALEQAATVHFVQLEGGRHDPRIGADGSFNESAPDLEPQPATPLLRYNGGWRGPVVQALTLHYEGVGTEAFWTRDALNAVDHLPEWRYEELFDTWHPNERMHRLVADLVAFYHTRMLKMAVRELQGWLSRGITLDVLVAMYSEGSQSRFMANSLPTRAMDCDSILCNRSTPLYCASTYSPSIGHRMEPNGGWKLVEHEFERESEADYTYYGWTDHKQVLKGSGSDGPLLLPYRSPAGVLVLCETNVEHGRFPQAASLDSAGLDLRVGGQPVTELTEPGEDMHLLGGRCMAKQCVVLRVPAGEHDLQVTVRQPNEHIYLSHLIAL